MANEFKSEEQMRAELEAIDSYVKKSRATTIDNRIERLKLLALIDIAESLDTFNAMFAN